MRALTRLILPATAVSSYFFTVLLYHFYIWSGRHHKILQSANLKLRENVNNASVNDYMQILSTMKKFPNTQRNFNLLLDAYSLVRSSKAVNDDLKTQFRVTILLKGLNRI